MLPHSSPSLSRCVSLDLPIRHDFPLPPWAPSRCQRLPPFLSCNDSCHHYCNFPKTTPIDNDLPNILVLFHSTIYLHRVTIGVLFEGCYHTHGIIRITNVLEFLAWIGHAVSKLGLEPANILRLLWILYTRDNTEDCSMYWDCMEKLWVPPWGKCSIYK